MFHYIVKRSSYRQARLSWKPSLFFFVGPLRYFMIDSCQCLNKSWGRMGSSFGKRVLWCSYCNKYISSVMMESFYPKSVVSVVDTARLTDSRELSTSPPIRIPSLAPILRAQKLTNFSITEWGFIFSVNRESIFFRPRETGFRLFRDPWNMCLLSRDFWINDFCGNNFSLFLEILGSLRGEKLKYKSVAKEISKPPFFGSWSPVGTESLPCLCNSRFL